MTGFGRKGLVAGQLAGSGVHGLSPAGDGITVDPAIAAKREAFLAAERSRRAEAVLDQPFAVKANPAAPLRREAKGRWGSDKSLATAYILWFFASAVSAHRFYLGAYVSALCQFGLWFAGLVTIVVASFEAGLSIAAPAGGWMLLDLFLIPGLYRRAVERETAVA